MAESAMQWTARVESHDVEQSSFSSEMQYLQLHDAETQKSKKRLILHDPEKNLCSKSSSFHEEFCSKNFVVQKSEFMPIVTRPRLSVVEACKLKRSKNLNLQKPKTKIRIIYTNIWR